MRTSHENRLPKTSDNARTRCYLASPLGFTEAGRHYLEHVYKPALARVVKIIDPWQLINENDATKAWTAERGHEAALEIGRLNTQALRSCPLLAAFLDGQELDGGTCAEIGFAAAIGTRCYGLRSDFRETGEPNVTLNLQIETFILDSGGAIVETLEELVSALATFR